MTSGNEMIPARRARRQDLATPDATHASAVPHKPVVTERWARRRGVLSVFATFAVVGFAAAYIGPSGAAVSQANAEDAASISLYASSVGDVQTRAVDESAESEPTVLDRGGYSVYVKPKPPPPPPVAAAPARGSASGWRPPFVTPDPGSAQAIAYQMVLGRGWGDDQFACLVSLWNKESGWRVNAHNRSSGAYGIPQALPGGKMASAGADWETNPATQIAWGLGYIGGRYGTPCGAWDHSVRVGWY